MEENLFFLSLGLCCLLAWSISCRNSVYLPAQQHGHVSFKHEHFTGSWDNSEFLPFGDFHSFLATRCHSETDTLTLASSPCDFTCQASFEEVNIVNVSLCSYCRLIIAEITYLLIGETLMGQHAKDKKESRLYFHDGLTRRYISSFECLS